MGRSAGKAARPLACTPWCGGSSPLSTVACEGRVRGTEATASSNTAPRCGQRVEVRRGSARRAVGADAIGAQRVDRDEQDARPVPVGGRAPPHDGHGRDRHQRAASRTTTTGRSRAAAVCRAGRSRQSRQPRLGALAGDGIGQGGRVFAARGLDVALHARHLAEVVVDLPVGGIDGQGLRRAPRAPRPAARDRRGRRRGRRRRRRCAAGRRSPSGSTAPPSSARPARRSASARRRFTSGFAGSRSAIGR